MLRRVPLESAQPMIVFALARLTLSAVALGAALALDRRVALTLAVAAIPWSVAMLLVTRRNPELALNPLWALGDLAVLVAIEVAEPEASAGVRTGAMFLVAAHAHFQGEARGVAMAATGSSVVVATSGARGDTGLPTDVVAFHEAVFMASALAVAVVVGRARATESASRLRARSLSRHTMRSESRLRRRLAESIHDGPVQELIGLNMMISAAESEYASGHTVRGAKLLGEARAGMERNVTALRDEIVDLGPHAFEELTLAGAIDNCMDTWMRRYGFEVKSDVEPVELSPEASGDLFRIVQEAVANAGRHASADAVSVTLRRDGPNVELRVTDDGHGFGDTDPTSGTEPGHLGLAAMRERAELLEGDLDIQTSEDGTAVILRASWSAVRRDADRPR